MTSYVSPKTHLLQAALLKSRFNELMFEMQNTISCQWSEFIPRIDELSRRVDEMRRSKVPFLENSVKEMEGYEIKARAFLLHRSSSDPSHVDTLCSPKVLKINTRTGPGSPSSSSSTCHRTLSVPEYVDRSCNPNILRMQTGPGLPSPVAPPSHRSSSVPEYVDRSCNPNILRMQTGPGAPSPVASPLYRSSSIPSYVDRSCNPNILRMQTGLASSSSFTNPLYRSSSIPTHIDKSWSPKVLQVNTRTGSGSPSSFTHPLYRSSSIPSYVDKSCSPKVLQVNTQTRPGSPSSFTSPFHRSSSAPAHIDKSCSPKVLQVDTRTGPGSPSSFTSPLHRSLSVPAHVDESCSPRVFGMQSSASSSNPFKFLSVELFESALRESQHCDQIFEIEGQITSLRQEIELSPYCLWSQFNPRINNLYDKIDKIAQYDVSCFPKFKRLVEETRALLFERSTRKQIEKFYKMSLRKEGEWLLYQSEKLDRKFQLLNRDMCEFEQGLTNGKHSSLETRKILLEKAKNTIRDRISAYKKRKQEETLPTESSDKISAPALLEKTKQLLALCGLLDQERVEEVLHTLKIFQTRIHFEASGGEMTIYECIFSHYEEGIVFSIFSLKQAIRCACIQLALEGFTMTLKEKGRLPAQEMFKELFSTLDIWEKYCHLEGVWLHQNKKMSREEETDRTTGALYEIYMSLF
jgi:hypothetical protein